MSKVIRSEVIRMKSEFVIAADVRGSFGTFYVGICLELLFIDYVYGSKQRGLCDTVESTLSFKGLDYRYRRCTRGALMSLSQDAICHPTNGG